MTQNQLAYWRDQETKRSNLRNEGLKAEDTRTKQIEANEKIRHNMSEEALTDRYKHWEMNNDDAKILEQTLNDFFFKPLTGLLGGLLA